MSTILSELKEDIRGDKRYWKNKRRLFKENEKKIEAVVAELKLPISTPITLRACAEEFNLSVTGGPAELKEVFRCFRKLGYEPSNRPTLPATTSFSTYFRKDGGPDFYLYFSSTICKRVKIGTKMVEQDIYEVICE